MISYTAKLWSEPSARDHAFMTGFATQIFRMQELPKELATWIIDQSKSHRSHKHTFAKLTQFTSTVMQCSIKNTSISF
jgi:hypothetical protein